MTVSRSSRQAGFTLLEVLAGIVARQSDMEAAERALRRMLRDLDRGNIMAGPPYFVGAAHEVSFTTTLPQAADMTTQLVDVAVGVDHRHRLVLRWRPHFANPIGPLPPPETVPILEHVDHLDLAYWQQAAPAGWTRSLPANVVPDLVRLRVVRLGGGVRRWPDIVAATAPQ